MLKRIPKVSSSEADFSSPFPKSPPERKGWALVKGCQDKASSEDNALPALSGLMALHLF